jgi:hypothetical protein
MAIMSSREEDMSLDVLPEACIANVLSFTCPRDACRLSMVCSLFKAAEESDFVWERFLPRDYQSIISKSDASSMLLASASSKKHLYLMLCEKPLIIEGGKKVYFLSPFFLFFYQLVWMCG